MNVEQRDASLVMANQKRLRAAALKRQIAAGEIAVSDVLRSREPALENFTLLEIARLAPRFGRGVRYRGTRNLEAFGRSATLSGVNLCLTLKAASDDTVEWVAATMEGADPTQVDPTCMPWREQVKAAESKAAKLSEAIQAHRKTVTSPATPSDKWAVAEETLWSAHDRIMKAAA